MDETTVIEFSCDREIWPEVAGWAEEAGYAAVDAQAWPGLYRKGSGAMSAARMLSVAQSGSDVRIEAWVQTWPILRVLGVPQSMGIESGGFRNAVPRKLARTDLNRLLEQLGGPVVE